MRTTSMLVALCMVAMCAPALAQAVNAPVFRVGDVWVYERINDRNGLVINRYASTVEAISDAVHIRVLNADGRVFLVKFTKEGNYIGNDLASASPYRAALKFPLSAGSQWREPYTWRSRSPIVTGQSQMNELQATYAVKVAGVESIGLPTGTIEAWKLESQVFMHGALVVREQYWYSPVLKRVVRQQYQDTTGRVDSWTDSLIGYSVDGASSSRPGCESFSVACLLSAGPAIGTTPVPKQ